MIALVLLGLAHADRPDDGTAQFSFDAADVLDFVDGPAGAVRVHFSVSGPNVTLLDDGDGDGQPDYPAEVAATAEDVLAFYSSLGFLPPLSEDDLGLGKLGGSSAFDFYLVDFGGSSDGHFSADACAGDVCTGHMIIENDFVGYGYSSISEAVTVLTSHELFHAVQAAYSAGQPPWLSEGTAVWAEHQYDAEVDDFFGFCDAYLRDTGRSIDRPPAGTVTAFSYGTALFFQFLTERLGAGVGPDIQLAMEGTDEDEAMAAVVSVIKAHGSSIEEEWATFTRWNLATGPLAGEAESYPFASRVGPVTQEASGASIVDDNRFYPLAATYYSLDHDGGELGFESAEDASGLVFSLHPTGDDGKVLDPLEVWSPDGPVSLRFGDLPAARYWLVGSFPQQAEQSVKVAFCLGGPDATAACAPEVGDSGDADTGGAAPEPKGCHHIPAGHTLPAVILAWGIVAANSRRRDG